ncbi:glycosyltransferase [Tessaracoccus oleiagri]|uniref:Glycosyltransferase involved in cell wall bisynthesis n=1 Tax=Tessaracoccus oleiagri TaxID=686624 RepID=A0A1G9JAR1_9ACTN|nr:glycosyltransferase [Tessaracoccus oleiagri]SDL34382.1 Glycosyltransferase involved in cell wall bisynthesis [Tessaracoccus oleiagri]
MTTGYVVKVYPRFSETFIVTEILAREAAGEQLAIYATRPTTDARFHPEIAKVQAPVTHLARPSKASDLFSSIKAVDAELPGALHGLAELMPLVHRIDSGDLAQGLDLARRVRADGIDHLHAHFANSAARVACIAAHLAGITWSVTAHAKDIFHEDVDERLLEELLTRADRVITISRYNLEHLSDRFPQVADHLHLVRNGLDLARFPYREPRSPEGPLRVAAVGRLVEKKGFDVLLDSARAARDHGLELDVRIAGDGELAHDLSRLAADLGLGDAVTFLGPRSQDEVVELLRWADVMAAPCVVGADGNADGLPTVLLEAMATGVVPISTRVTGIPEAVHAGGDGRPATGLLLEPGDRDGLTRALLDVADPDFPRAEVSRAARELVEREYDTARQSRLLSEVTA